MEYYLHFICSFNKCLLNISCVEETGSGKLSLAQGHVDPTWQEPEMS